jgi:hypothetical protein
VSRGHPPQDHLARRPGPCRVTALRELDTGRALAAEQDAVYQRVRDESEAPSPMIGIRDLSCFNDPKRLILQ